MYFGFDYSGTEKVMSFNGDGLNVLGTKVARVAAGSSVNSGKISWGTAAAGTLAEGEIYLRYS
jgi:hypothetical protein